MKILHSYVTKLSQNNYYYFHNAYSWRESIFIDLFVPFVSCLSVIKIKLTTIYNKAYKTIKKQQQL